MAGANILVADDAEGHRMLLEMLLSADGHVVHTVADGREALEYLKTETPDLAILDVAMPGISGIDVCHRMKRVARLKGVPVVILTALTDGRTQEMARMARADAVITKPLEGKDFRAAVNALLARADDAG
ncbi:MAG TPA: response regulator [Trueperaceae bacterium]|nr:response regulator [Trueperaceae bacterium]